MKLNSVKTSNHLKMQIISEIPELLYIVIIQLNTKGGFSLRSSVTAQEGKDTNWNTASSC